MSKPVFYHPREYSREEAKEVFASADPASITELMIGLACHDDDWRWVLDRCVELATSEHAQLRYVSALCISNLARIRGEIDLSLARPVLLRLEADSEQSVRGMAEDAIGDIQIFLDVDLRDGRMFN